ncbi:TetR/AcrR family transcriptional regulator [Pseudovibrio sp. SPO723]|uniref:TetR/AcrR family transcriptional regulator n=1 Tax=Nesiotobacter zosterae TaxID=392721 RepID=UPI0029C43E9C|nr:TetR/AcrR family transcriptional regulator [Pseudovibrio sp. SPO723]MDX5592643.1 TetR/AcrR family transcriptional regulator [Pseudovibrio sp. SPO723]
MTEHKSRGRPRKFNREKALEQIKDLFWENGFSATSLDDIAKATGINRPSLYAAFGNKEDMYIASLELFAKSMSTMAEQSLEEAPDLRTGLINIFNGAISIYTAGLAAAEAKADAKLGCFVACTAPAETLHSEAIGTALQKIISELDAKFAVLLQEGNRTAPTIPEEQRPLVGHLLGILLNGISLRARAGANASELKQIAVHGIDCLLTPQHP